MQINPDNSSESRKSFRTIPIDSNTSTKPFERKKSRHWSKEQNSIYSAFLKEFSELFSTERRRRKEQVFKVISQKMENRKTSEQCRMHHKKMLQKYKTIQGILTYLDSKMTDSPQNDIQNTIKQQDNFQNGNNFPFDLIGESISDSMNFQFKIN